MKGPAVDMLHIAQRGISPRVWIDAFVRELERLGPLTIVENGEDLSEEERAERVRRCDALLLGWGSAPVPDAIIADPGRLGYICNITGGLRQWVGLGLIRGGIPVTNWGDAPAQRLAEGAFCLLLALVKDLIGLRRTVRLGGWRPGPEVKTGTLDGLNVGLYGFGAIGRRFEEMLRPFRPTVRVFDPYVEELPETCLRVTSLEALFDLSEAVAIHCGLSDETRGAVTADLLARLPDHSIIVNTARGGVIVQEALFAELERGRLRAGLDVLDPDSLPEGHPAREWDNVLLTAHSIGRARDPDGGARQTLDAFHRVCLENLRRFAKGEPLEFVMDEERYLRST